MPKLKHPQDVCNPSTNDESRKVVLELPPLTDADVERIAQRTAAIILAEIRSEPLRDPDELRTRDELARAVGVSLATIDRLTREGMPVEIVGNGKRYHVGRCREWLATRGRKRTTETKKNVDDIDISDVVEAAGLRRVGGNR